MLYDAMVWDVMLVYCKANMEYILKGIRRGVRPKYRKWFEEGSGFNYKW